MKIHYIYVCMYISTSGLAKIISLAALAAAAAAAQPEQWRQSWWLTLKYDPIIWLQGKMRLIRPGRIFSIFWRSDLMSSSFRFLLYSWQRHLLFLLLIVTGCYFSGTFLLYCFPSELLCRKQMAVQLRCQYIGHINPTSFPALVLRVNFTNYLQAFKTHTCGENTSWRRQSWLADVGSQVFVKSL